MCLMGVIRDGKVVLDQPAALPNGTRVEVALSPIRDVDGVPRPGSPEAVLRLVGTLTDQEADAIMRVVEEQRTPTSRIWEPGSDER